MGGLRARSYRIEQVADVERGAAAPGADDRHAVDVRITVPRGSAWTSRR